MKNMFSAPKESLPFSANLPDTPVRVRVGQFAPEAKASGCLLKPPKGDCFVMIVSAYDESSSRSFSNHLLVVPVM